LPGAGVVEEGRVRHGPVERGQVQRTEPVGHVAVENPDSISRLIQVGILAREASGDRIALQPGQRNSGMTGRDLHQHGPGAAARLEQAVARTGSDGGGQQGCVHARPIAACGLTQADTPVQKSVLDDIRGGGSHVQASISLTLRGPITIVRGIAIRQADAVGIA
jgi:hypothetical protein